MLRRSNPLGLGKQLQLAGVGTGAKAADMRSALVTTHVQDRNCMNLARCHWARTPSSAPRRAPTPANRLGMAVLASRQPTPVGADDTVLLIGVTGVTGRWDARLQNSPRTRGARTPRSANPSPLYTTYPAAA